MEIIIDIQHGEQMLQGIQLEELAVFTLKHEEIPDNTEVSISFVTDEEIAQLNAEYRGKDGPTDVLSFECDGLDDDMLLFEDDQLEVPEFALGDIVIAPDVALKQSVDYGTTFEQEISVLLVHGLLHLCGYDHIEDEDAAIMEPLEREILSAWFGYEVSFR